MSSISVGELKNILEEYPDDYEVVMDWRWKEHGEVKTAIAYINGICSKDDYKEVRLMN